MVIEGTFYKIIPSDTKFYDLELLKDIGGNNPRKEFKPEAYGLTFDRALKRCINYATKKNLPEVVTLKEYLDEYTRQAESIREELQKIGIEVK